MAARAAIPLAEALARYTNLQRRFGLGDIDAGPPPAQWVGFVGELESLDTPERRLAWTKAFFVTAPEDVPPADRTAFGCFSFDPPTAAGVVRIHFGNRDSTGGVGPLDQARRPRRLAELTEMFAAIRQAWPEANTVQGGSWLYNLAAYRRLFPAAYGDSRAPPEFARLRGTSSWGQFLDHREAIKPDLRAAFLRNIETIDIAAPWRAFPLPVLRTSAPMELFYDFYGV
ncbi:MAG TPA: hypothetical protein VHZ26_07550 [Caulobacteraceae bacterium]|jgi:hypothetical protein|nr:hypothetical protein [Caulobacteraceae bacterium]